MSKILNTKDLIHPLSAWFNRNHPIPERFYLPHLEDKPDENWFVWVTLEEMEPLYKAKEMKWISLKDSILRTNEYLMKASNLINGLEGGWLDGEEQMLLIETIGKPPEPCLPLYLITIQEGNNEVLVYVGITKVNSRFDGGHACALKLHNPKYDNKIKRIYRCSIWFHFNDEYIVLDWLKPDTLALRILESIESQFIFHFKPELNTKKKSKNRSKFDFFIHIQNSLDGGFLRDYLL